MTRPASRLNTEYDAAANHDLSSLNRHGVGHAMSYTATCACSWVSGHEADRTAARELHDTHQEVLLGLPSIPKRAMPRREAIQNQVERVLSRKITWFALGGLFWLIIITALVRGA